MICCIVFFKQKTAYEMRISDWSSDVCSSDLLKITTIGNSAGVILPKELLARLRLDKGDELYALETPDGIRLTAFDPELAAQMEVAERVMLEDRAVLRKLAQYRAALRVWITRTPTRAINQRPRATHTGDNAQTA